MMASKTMPPSGKIRDATPRHLHKGLVPTAQPRKKPNEMTNVEMRIELAKYGLKAVPISEIDATTQLTNRFDLFATDVKQSFEILAGQVLPLLNEIRDIVREHSTKLGDHDRRFDVHDKRIKAHEARHTSHESEITGLHRRLTAVEQTFTKLPCATARKTKKGKR